MIKEREREREREREGQIEKISLRERIVEGDEKE